MATMKPAYANEVSEIQRQMALVRHQMHQEVQGAVKGCANVDGLAQPGWQLSVDFPGYRGGGGLPACPAACGPGTGGCEPGFGVRSRNRAR